MFRHDTVYMDHPVYRGSYMPETASRPYRNSLTARRVMRSIGVPLLGSPLAFPAILHPSVHDPHGRTPPIPRARDFRDYGTERERLPFEENRRFNDSVRLFSWMESKEMIFVEVERSMHFWELERNIEARREVTLDRNSSNLFDWHF